MLPARALSIALLALFSFEVQGADIDWSVELLFGDAYNADSHTRIEQAAVGSISISGDYETRGLEGPLHYAWRIARWDEGRAWELQLLHHKIFLQNRPAGVDALSVSHGFNMLTLNRAVEYGHWRFRAGLGPVITHAEARIAGTSYDGPYEIAGAAVLIGLGRTVKVSSHWYLLGELSATFGYAHVHPHGSPDLEVTIRNPAVHAQIGAGYRF